MWSTSGATPTPGAEPREHARAERPAGARHLGAAGHAGEDRLVVGQRPVARLVRVADRRSVLGEEREQRRRQLQRGDPQPPGGEVWRDELRHAAAGEREPLAAAGAVEARAALPQLDDPATRHRGLGRRQVELDRGAVRALGCSAAGSVADSFTTSRSPARRKRGRSRKRACTSGSPPRATISRTWSRASPRASGGSAASSDGGSENASAALTRAPRRAPRPSSARSAGRPRSARAGRARSARAQAGRRCPRPGYASWCMRVFMSPGSTA